MRPSFHYLAAFPQVQARRGDRVPAARAPAGEQERYLCNSWPVSRSHYVSRRSWGRMLEQFMRLKQNLYCGRHISGNIRLNHGKEPALMLHSGGEAEIGAHLVIPAHANIGQRASSGNELLTHLLVPEIELHTIACVEPVIRPRLSALALAANPTA